MQIDRSAGAEDEGGAWRPTERCAGRVDDSEIEQMPSDLLDATSLLTPAVLRPRAGSTRTAGWQPVVESPRRTESVNLSAKIGATSTRGLLGEGLQ